jgi:type II secretory pathway component GspD/PulD (secretin)
MKTSLFQLALASATFSCAFPLLQPVAMAQEAPAANQVVTERIVMQNVSPNIMAWWLDPAHQTEPIAFQLSRRNTEGVLPPSTIDPGKPLGDYQLPEGIIRISPLDPRNTLTVQGTPAGISKLKEAIATLDKPLPQMEIEIQYVYMDEADLKKFGVATFNQSAEAGPFKWGVLPDRLVGSDVVTSQPVALTPQGRLGELLRKSKAQLVTAPRVTAINNLTASLRSTTIRPQILNSVDWPTLDEAGVLVYLSRSTGINIRPTINEDETIDLVLAPGLSLQMNVLQGRVFDSKDNSPTDKKTVVWRRQLGGVQTLRNLKDGETVVLTGQNASNFLPNAAPFKPRKSKNLVLFVTPRLVRRLTIDKSVVATPPAT